MVRSTRCGRLRLPDGGSPGRELRVETTAHDDHPARVRVRLEAPERALQRRQRAHVPDRAEHADDRVVTPAQIEVDHVRNSESTRRILATCDPPEIRVDVDAINLEAVRAAQQPRVLARAAGNIEQRPRRGCSARMRSAIWAALSA